MVDNLFLHTKQVEMLFDLLYIEYSNPGVKIEGLDLMIARAKAPMSGEWISEVELSVEKLFKKN